VSTLEKALITKEQAVALENALSQCEKKSLVIENHIHGLWSGCRKPLSGLSLETLIVATYIGYNIERTKEEKLLAYIKQLNDDAEQGELIASSKMVGVMKALEILGIELIES
jgi:hypothetical protein